MSSALSYTRDGRLRMLAVLLPQRSAAAPGVSLNGVVGGSVALDGQWSGVALVKRGADAWIIQGALAGAVA